MKPSIITAALGVILIGFGIFLMVIDIHIGMAIPILIGGSLIYNAFWGGRIATLIFGHVCVAVGAYLITWGFYLPPISELTISRILFGPLFWGIFSLMGGICAIFHGFCRCVTKQVEQFETMSRQVP